MATKESVNSPSAQLSAQDADGEKEDRAALIRLFHSISEKQRTVLLNLRLDKCPAEVAEVFRLYVKTAADADT